MTKETNRDTKGSFGQQEQAVSAGGRRVGWERYRLTWVPRDPYAGVTTSEVTRDAATQRAVTGAPWLIRPSAP